MISETDLKQWPGMAELLDRAHRLRALDYEHREPALMALIDAADARLCQAVTESRLNLPYQMRLQGAMRYWMYMNADVYATTEQFRSWTDPDPEQIAPALT